MAHTKELSNAKRKQGLNKDDRGGCQRDFLVKVKRLGGDYEPCENQSRS